MITNEQLPRDGNGVLRGVYRIVHRDPAFNGGIGAFDLADGVSKAPAYGRALVRAVLEYGNEIFLEPWGEPVDPYALPELLDAEVPADFVATLERAPWREPAVAPIVAEALEEAPEDEALDAEVPDGEAPAATKPSKKPRR